MASRLACIEDLKKAKPDDFLNALYGVLKHFATECKDGAAADECHEALDLIDGTFREVLSPDCEEGIKEQLWEILNTMISILHLFSANQDLAQHEKFLRLLPVIGNTIRSIINKPGEGKMMAECCEIVFRVMQSPVGRVRIVSSHVIRDVCYAAGTFNCGSQSPGILVHNVFSLPEFKAHVIWTEATIDGLKYLFLRYAEICEKEGIKWHLLECLSLVGADKFQSFIYLQQESEWCQPLVRVLEKLLPRRLDTVQRSIVMKLIGFLTSLKGVEWVYEAGAQFAMLLTRVCSVQIHTCLTHLMENASEPVTEDIPLSMHYVVIRKLLQFKIREGSNVEKLGLVDITTLGMTTTSVFIQHALRNNFEYTGDQRSLDLEALSKKMREVLDAETTTEKNDEDGRQKQAENQGICAKDEIKNNTEEIGESEQKKGEDRDSGEIQEQKDIPEDIAESEQKNIPEEIGESEQKEKQNKDSGEIQEQKDIPVDIGESEQKKKQNKDSGEIQEQKDIPVEIGESEQKKKENKDAGETEESKTSGEGEQTEGEKQEVCESVNIEKEHKESDDDDKWEDANEEIGETKDTKKDNAGIDESMQTQAKNQEASKGKKMKEEEEAIDGEQMKVKILETDEDKETQKEIGERCRSKEITKDTTQVDENKKNANGKRNDEEDDEIDDMKRKENPQNDEMEKESHEINQGIDGNNKNQNNGIIESEQKKQDKDSDESKQAEAVAETPEETSCQTSNKVDQADQCEEWAKGKGNTIDPYRILRAADFNRSMLGAFSAWFSQVHTIEKTRPLVREIVPFLKQIAKYTLKELRKKPNTGPLSNADTLNVKTVTMIHLILGCMIPHEDCRGVLLEQNVPDLLYEYLLMLWVDFLSLKKWAREGMESVQEVFNIQKKDNGGAMTADELDRTPVNPSISGAIGVVNNNMLLVLGDIRLFISPILDKNLVESTFNKLLEFTVIDLSYIEFKADHPRLVYGIVATGFMVCIHCHQIEKTPEDKILLPFFEAAIELLMKSFELVPIKSGKKVKHMSLDVLQIYREDWPKVQPLWKGCMLNIHTCIRNFPALREYIKATGWHLELLRIFREVKVNSLDKYVGEMFHGVLCECCQTDPELKRMIKQNGGLHIAHKFQFRQLEEHLSY